MPDGCSDDLITGTTGYTPTPQQQASRAKWLQTATLIAEKVECRTPELAELARFMMPLLPAKPLVADDVKGPFAASWNERLTTAVDRQYLDFNDNQQGIIRALTIDIDEPGIVSRVVDAFMTHMPHGLQPLIVVEPHKGTAHVTWFLDSPIYSKA